MKTYDEKEVKAGDIVFVIGSSGVREAKVLPPVTSYVIFGNVEVKDSFSTREAAENYRNTPQD